MAPKAASKAPARHPTAADIRAVEDGRINPLNGQPFSARHTVLVGQRRKFPLSAEAVVDEILGHYFSDSHRVILISAATGTGKTTQLLQLLLQAKLLAGKREPGDKRIFTCTQPRVASAVNVALRVADEMDVKLGQGVGLRFRDANGTFDADVTRLSFDTDGLVLAQRKSDPKFSRVDTLMLDEAHERNINTDLLIGMLRQCIINGDTIPRLIIASATLNSTFYQTTFPGAPMVEIAGRNHKVEILYVHQETSIADMICRIHVTQPRGNILVFLPGVGQINKVKGDVDNTIRRLREGGMEQLGKLNCVTFHAKLSKEDQQLALGKEPITPKRMPDRNVIISTNVAETSLTIDRVVYVVDCCMVNEATTNPRNEIGALYEVATSKASCMQRAGRAGRVEPGVCYRMISQYAYQRDVPDHKAPDILKTDITSAVLTLLIAGMDTMTFPYPTAPAPETLMRALSNLKGLGLIKNIADQGTKYPVTSKGKLAASIPAEPYLARALIDSVSNKCLLEMLSVVAMVSAQSSGSGVYRHPRPNNKQDTDKYVATTVKFTTGLGTHIDFLVIYNAYMCAYERGVDQVSRFFEQYFFDGSVLRSAQSMIPKLFMGLLNGDRTIQPPLAMDVNDPLYFDRVRQSLCAGYFMQSAMRTGKKCYTSVIHHVEATLDLVNKPGQPKLFRGNHDADFDDGRDPELNWIIYDTLIDIKGNIKITNPTTVRLAWLLRAGMAEFYDMLSCPPGPIKDALVAGLRELTVTVDLRPMEYTPKASKSSLTTGVGNLGLS